MRHVIAFLSLFTLAACATAGTQSTDSKPTPSAPAVGDSATPLSAPLSAPLPRAYDRVRVVLPRTETQPERFITGRLVRLTPDTVFITDGLSTEAVPLDGRQLQVAVHSRGRPLRGLWIGTLAGAAAGGLIGAVSYTPCHSTEFMGCMFAPTSAGEAAAMGAVGGAVVGAVVGLIAGAMTPQVVWGTVALPQPGVAPQVSAVGVRLSF